MVQNKNKNMKAHLILIVLCFIQFTCFSQNKDSANAAKKTSKYDIGFKKSRDTMYRSNTKKKAWDAEILANNNTADNVKDYTIDVSVNDKSTLPKEDYEVFSNISGKKISELKKEGNSFIIYVICIGN